MKILFNTYLGAFHKPGGGEVVILKLKDALIKRGHHVKLLNHHTDRFDDYDIIHEFSLWSWKNWGFYKANNLKFVLTPTCWPRISFMTLFKERFKYFITSLYQKKDRREYLRDYLHYPELIMPTTSLELDRMQKAYPGLDMSKLQIIPNGVDKPISEKELDCHLKEDYCLYVGTIAPNKNLLMAIKVCLDLKVPLVIIGDYKEEDLNYYNECRSYESESIIFKGRINEAKKLASYYYHAKCTLILSDFETCSLVGLESATYATPILITKNGGTKEVFKDYASYCDGSNFTQVKERLEDILRKNTKNEDLKKYVLDNFSWDIIAEKVEAIYQKIQPISD